MELKIASVEFDIQSLGPTYRLLIGTPGSSKAFLISKRLGLSEEIIGRAQQLVNEDYAEFDKVLTLAGRAKKALPGKTVGTYKAAAGTGRYTIYNVRRSRKIRQQKK